MKKENGVLTEATNKDLKLLEENPAKFWEGMTTIGSRAFENCKYLEKIELPEGLTEIEALAFLGCSKLKEIKVPEGVKKLGSWAFAECSSLERIELPEGLAKIECAVFKDCSKLKEIKVPKSIKKIEDFTFVGCSSLERIELPDGITEIREYAFNDCSNLKEIILPKSVKRIESGTFYGCSNLERIELPDCIEKIKCSFDTISPEAIIQYKGRIFKQGLLSLDYQIGEMFDRKNEDFETTATLLNNNLFPFFVYDLTNKEIIKFNPKLWTKLTNQIYQNIKKSTNVVNLKDLFTLARNVGIFDEERMMTIKNGQGKDIQVHVNELAFNFLQKFTINVPIDAMHMYLSSMQAKGINEEFIKFISNKVNYDEIISKLETNDSILTNIYNWFIERGALENLTDIERDDNLTNMPTSEKNRYKVRTYETGESGVDKTRWKAPTVELIIKELSQKKFIGITTPREREIAEELREVTDYQQKHFDKAIEIDKEREERKVPDFIVGKHIGQNRTQAYMEYAEKTKDIKGQILEEAGEIINNQVDISNKIFTYDTLAKSDIANFSIGFMTSCCARLYGAGAGAMRASILHKDMQPLVVRNDKDEIVAYSILYVNREEGYAVLNDIEVNTKYSGQEEQLKIIYEKMRRGAIENIEEYNKTTKVPITKLNCGITPNWDAVNEYIKKNPESSILKAPNFDDFKYAGSGSWKGDWHKGQWTIWEEDGNERL